MLFLGGVVASDPGKVSIYLVCTSTSKEGHPCAQMAFAMSNPNDPTTYLTYSTVFFTLSILHLTDARQTRTIVSRHTTMTGACAVQCIHVK